MFQGDAGHRPGTRRVPALALYSFHTGSKTTH